MSQGLNLKRIWSKDKSRCLGKSDSNMSRKACIYSWLLLRCATWMSLWERQNERVCNWIRSIKLYGHIAVYKARCPHISTQNSLVSLLLFCWLFESLTLKLSLPILEMFSIHWSKSYCCNRLKFIMVYNHFFSLKIRFPPCFVVLYILYIILGHFLFIPHFYIEIWKSFIFSTYFAFFYLEICKGEVR